MTEDKQEFPLSPRGETLPIRTENRVLILGSSVSGVFELRKDFQAYLEEKDIPEPNVEVLRDVAMIETAILGRETIEEDRGNPNLPKGVILLPEMRQYSPTGMGMSLDTDESGISDFVKKLCQRWGIPLVKIQEYKSPEQIEEGLKKLLEPKAEK